MVNESRDDDRTRKEGTFRKESEEVVRDEDGTHTKETYTRERTDDDFDDESRADFNEEPRADRPRDDYDENRADTGNGNTHPGLLWFSVAGAIIMGALWIIDITGLFGLTWAVLGSTTTLAIAIIAAIGALLFWYHDRKAKRTTTA